VIRVDIISRRFCCQPYGSLTLSKGVGARTVSD
jgi:hypothetical protein